MRWKFDVLAESGTMLHGKGECDLGVTSLRKSGVEVDRSLEGGFVIE